MAYSGTTAATTARNPMRLTAGGALYSGNVSSTGTTTLLSTASETPNAQGAQFWSYCSTNKTTDLKSMSVTDGAKLGMRPGDLVFCTQFTTAGSSITITIHAVASVNSTAGTATLSGGAKSVISSTYS